MPLDVTPTLAAVKYEAGFDINRLILEVVTDLQARGRLIGGVLQELEASGDPSCLRLKAVDVRTRKAASITRTGVGMRKAASSIQAVSPISRIALPMRSPPGSTSW